MWPQGSVPVGTELLQFGATLMKSLIIAVCMASIFGFGLSWFLIVFYKLSGESFDLNANFNAISIAAVFYALGMFFLLKWHSAKKQKEVLKASN